MSYIIYRYFYLIIDDNFATHTLVLILFSETKKQVINNFKKTLT